MLAGLFLAVAAAGAAETCGERLSRDELVQAVEKAENSFAELDDAGFRDRFNELAGLILPCMGDLVPKDLAARYHRLMAIHLYALGDRVGAAEAIAAARASAGDQPLPGDLLAGDLAAAWSAAPSEQSTRRVPEPRTGSLAFDGENQRERPADSATVVQLFDASGQALETAWLGSRDPMPAYAAIPRRRNALIGISVGTGLAAAGAFAGAAVSHGSLYRSAADPGVSGAELDQLRATTNLLSVAGGIGLVAAFGAGAGAVLVGPR